MQADSLKRKESQAELPPSPSPQKKQATKELTALELPCTQLCPKSGEFKWRTKGVEATKLKEGFAKHRQKKGLEGLAYARGTFDSKYIEEIRESQPFWSIYSSRKFAHNYRRAADRFSNSIDIEDIKEGGRSKLSFRVSLNLILISYLILLCLFVRVSTFIFFS